MSDVFGNPAYVGGQAQNLTGDIVVPGGSNSYGPQLPALGWSGGSAASSNGGVLNLGTLHPTTSTPTQTAQAGSGTAASGASVLDGINSYFVRAIVIILGFIFVAVGLSLFRQPLAPAQFNPLPRK